MPLHLLIMGVAGSSVMDSCSQGCIVLEKNSKIGHVTYFVSKYLVKRIKKKISIPAKDICCKMITDILYFAQVDHSHPIWGDSVTP